MFSVVVFHVQDTGSTSREAIFAVRTNEVEWWVRADANGELQITDKGDQYILAALLRDWGFATCLFQTRAVIRVSYEPDWATYEQALRMQAANDGARLFIGDDRAA